MSPKIVGDESMTQKYEEKEEKERLQAISLRNLDMQSKNQFRI